MSSDSVVYNCSICSKIINGRQNFAICVKCQRRVHRICCDGRFSNRRWAEFRQTFACSTCEAVAPGSLSHPVDAEEPVVSFRNTCVNNVNVSTNVPPMNKYEIMIGASRKGGDIVSDGRGYTYRFQLDYPNLRVWMCTFRGCDKYPRCNSTLKQITRPRIDFLRTYSQEDFSLNADQMHRDEQLHISYNKFVAQW